MAKNNKNTYIYKNQQDITRRANERRKSVEKYDSNKAALIKEEISDVYQSFFIGKEVVVNSNIGTISNHKFKYDAKRTNKNYEYTKVTEAIKKLHDNNFYDIITGKVNTANDLLVQSIENNTKLQMVNQAGKSNESLHSFKQKIDYMKELKENNGTFVAYDLETIGAQDAHGIWRPTNITEFSMHQYETKGNVVDGKFGKVDILLGWQDKDEAKNLLTRIKSAIKDGTIDYDSELSVSAHRLSLYGNAKVTSEFDNTLGVFKVGNFIDTKHGDNKDIKAIEKGVDFFLDIGKKIGKDKHGVPFDVKLMMETLAENNKLLSSDTKHAMLIDYNGSLFDKPIMDSIGNKYLEKHPSLKTLFDNKPFSLKAEGNKHMDTQGALQHFRNNFSTKELLGEAVNGIDESRLNRQEHYIKALHQQQFNDLGLKPHEASSDVTALSFFYTQESDKLGGKTLMDYISDKLEPIIPDKVFDLNPEEHILRAKSFNNGTSQGKNLLNFAIDKNNNNIYTADNHMIRNGVIKKQDFNVGVGLNKGAFYQLGGVRRVSAGDEYIKTMGDIFPQYASGDMFAVSMNMMTTKDFKDSRLDTLEQVLLFNSETELQSFFSNTFDVVAEKVDGEFKILNRDAFDIREYDMINGRPVYKDVNKNYKKTDMELITDSVGFQNKKLTTSRAENSINGDNAYNNIRKALDIQTLAQKEMGKSIDNRELNWIMSGRIASGEMAVTIEESLANKMKAGITSILEHSNGVYDSTIDNMSTYMNTIRDNSAYYSKLLEILDENSRFSTNKSATVKKEMFKRADRQARELLASNIYDSEGRIKKSILGDETLQAPMEKFKTMFELNLAEMSGAKREYFYDITKAKEGNLLRLDLGKTANIEYDLINSVNKAIQGDRKIRPEDEFKATNKNFKKFIGHMLEDKDFKESINKDFKSELLEIINDDKKYNHIDVADRIVKQFKEIKKANPFTGIKSKDLFMKDLTSTSGYTKALNGEKFLNSLQTELSPYIESLDLNLLNGNKHAAEEFVNSKLLKFYTPENATGIVQEKAKEEMRSYLTDIVHSSDKIGANISVNDFGDITLNSDGKNTILNLPKIKADRDSNIWYIQTGNMNNKLTGKLNMDLSLGGKEVKMNIGTNLGEAIGTFPLEKSVQKYYQNQMSGIATKNSMDEIEQIINSTKKKVIKSSTVNKFNGNDLNSNRLIDASSISNVLKEVFNDNGQLNYLVKNHEFLDSTLQEVLGKDVARYIQSSKPIEKLDANMTKDLIKNMPHLLEILGVKAGVEGTEVEEVLKNLSFTGNVKQSSNMIGVLGDMPTFSPQAPLDNLQRPPILAAGNAIPLRAKAIKELEGSGVLAGNLISTVSTDKATMRYVAGIGETTTDVMMDIAYVSTDALEIIKTNNMEKVLAKNNVDENYIDRMTAMFTKMSKMNTYEQERHMDGRIAEKLYGLMPSRIQNVTASKDIASSVNFMSIEDSRNQLDLLTGLKGNISVDKGGVLSYKSATGKYVKRGDSLIQTLGFGDKLEAVSPQAQQGVFLHKYMKTNGMSLTDEEITNIINKNKSAFMKNGKMLGKTSANLELDKLLVNQYEANGLYRIQDISAAGYIKPTTSSTEKGMTNLNYVKTGSLNKDVDKFFKSIGMEDVSRQSVLYDESIDSILNYVGNNKTKAGLKQSGFQDIKSLKKAINIERNEFNKFVMDDIFGGKAHMFVNDGVFKHGGAGQVQFGVLNKAIDNFTKANSGSRENSLKEVTRIINENSEYQFLSTRDLNGASKAKATKFRMKDGRIHMDDMGTNVNNLTVSNIKSLENLITEIDNRTVKLGGLSVVHKEGYIQKWNNATKQMDNLEIGKTYDQTYTNKNGEVSNVYTKEGSPFKVDKLFGEWMTEEVDGKNVFLTPITKESVKLLPDVETQTGTESEYFKLKDQLLSLKSRKNSTNDASERQKLIEDIGLIESQLKNYESVSKRMSVGTTEFQLLERMRVTEQHAQQMQELMNNGKIDSETADYLLASDALRGRVVRGEDGRIRVNDKLKNEPVLDHWLKRFKGQLTFNPLEEFKLTAKDVEEGADLEHLATIYNRANKYQYDVGQESAQKLYQYEMADHAVNYNQTKKFTKDKMSDLGFETVKIDDINFEVDEIAKKNLLVDLGPEFSDRNRYIAVAGTGHKLNEDEEILTNGQKEIRKLARKYDEWKDVRYDIDKSDKLKIAILDQADETKVAIKESIYGKNAYADIINKVQIDDVNYRYKASGAVTSEFTPGLSKAIKNGEIANLKVDDELLRGSEINGKSLSEWHSKGVHYDYKFVSSEAMKDMGMFDEDVMKAYGASNREEMIGKLKKYGTMDITDRYPNNKNDSMLLTHTFLDEGLVGNETKVAGASGLKMNLDHDGDSVSSFALRYKTKDGTKLDYGMFLNNPEYVNNANKEAHETFSNMLALTTTRATTDNIHYAEKVNDILIKDAMKNSDFGDLTKTALVPGGKSVLSQSMPAGLSHMDTVAGTEVNKQQINDLLSQAKSFIGDGNFEGILAKDLDLKEDKAEFVLDKALTVMQEAKSKGVIDDSSLATFENAAIKKIGIDRLAIQNSANTGVATTGAINVATNSIKMAAHDSLIKDDPIGSDIIRAMLDIPEQEAISSKKIISAYDDKRSRDMTEILGQMFNSKNNKKTTAIASQDITDLRTWFKDNAKDKVVSVYDEFAPKLSKAATADISSKTEKFDYIMDEFTNRISFLSEDEYFQSKRLNYKSRHYDGMVAGYSDESYSARQGRMIGKADDSFHIRAKERKAMKEEVMQRQSNAKQFFNNSQTTKQTSSVLSSLIDGLSSGSSMSLGGGLAMGALGLAGGLMAAGYASGNPLNDKSASQVAGEEYQQPVQTMSVPDFMEKQGGFVTGNSQQGYIINIKADTKKGKKHMQRVMKQAAEALVGGAVSVNMNIRSGSRRGVTDSDIENFLERNL